MTAPGRTDDDMVHQRDLKKGSGLCQTAGESSIRLAGSRVTRGMIVSHGDGVGSFFKCRTENLTRMSDAFVQTTPRYLAIAQQSMTGVEQEDTERLAREALHFGTEQGEDHPGPVDTRTFLFGTGHATPHLKGGLEFRRLCWTDPGSSREFPRGTPCKPAEGPPLRKKGFGNGHHIAPSHSGSQEDRQKFGIGQYTRSMKSQALPGLLRLGKFPENRTDHTPTYDRERCSQGAEPRIFNKDSGRNQRVEDAPEILGHRTECTRVTVLLDGCKISLSLVHQ